jgi:hypothetical protein
MEQGHSSETKSHSVCQQIPCLFMEPKGSLPCSQEPANGPYPDPDKSTPRLPALFP